VVKLISLLKKTFKKVSVNDDKSLKMVYINHGY